jgi:hypothetical protein
MKIEFGSIFTLDTDLRKNRVIMFDDLEVFSTVWWEHINNWASTQLKGSCIYYRFDRKIFDSRCTIIGQEDLSPEEYNFHRPDLPFRICRFSDVSWTNIRKDGKYWQNYELYVLHPYFYLKSISQLF